MYDDDTVIHRNGKNSLHHIQKVGRLSKVPTCIGSKSISTIALIVGVFRTMSGHNISVSLSSYIHEMKSVDPSYAEFMYNRLTALAMNESGDGPMAPLWDYVQGTDRRCEMFRTIEGFLPNSDPKVVYDDRDFDLLCPSHIEYLRIVTGSNSHAERGIKPYVIVGLYGDIAVNGVKGGNFRVANVCERAMCLLQSTVSLYAFPQSKSKPDFY